MNTKNKKVTQKDTAYTLIQEKLPRRRIGHTHTFKIDDLKGYITTGEYPDGRLGEVSIIVSKQGSTLQGLVGAWSVALSLGLQYGVPLESYIEKYSSVRFEPFGMTNDKEVKTASSIVDYVLQRLAIDYLDADKRQQLKISSQIDPKIEGPSENQIHELFERIKKEESKTPKKFLTSNMPLCSQCGSFMQPSGSCHVCVECGTTSGCS